jgi:hypothetical protein
MKILQSRLFWAALLLSVFAANAAWNLRNRLNADAAWYLYAVTRLHHGAILYKDLQDINLPIVYFIYMPVAWLSSFTHLDIQLALHATLLTLSAYVLYLFGKAASPDNRIAQGITLFTVAFAILSLNRLHLAQRDTLCAILFAGLVLSAAAPKSIWTLVLMASLGMAMKPHFLIPWLLIAFTLWPSWKRLELWLPPAVSILSWIVTLTAFPRYLDMVAIASRYYSNLNVSFWMFLPLVPPLYAVTLVLLSKKKFSPLTRLSALATIGFGVECLLQRKAFPYHFVPAMLWSVITLGLAAAERWHKRPTAILAGALALTAYSLWTALVSPPVFTRDPVDDFVLAHARSKTVLSLCTSPWRTFPLVLEANAINARPDGSLWTIGGMYRDQVEQAGDKPARARYHTRAEMQDFERTAFDQVVQAVTASRPAVILVETVPDKWGLGQLQFDFLEYFSTDPRFKEALRHYKPGPSTDQRLVLSLVDDGGGSNEVVSNR